MSREFVLPDYVCCALSMLERSGFQAYVVGGCIRDFLMGIEPNDYDICTSAKPNETVEVFSDYKIIETGLKHGTVTVLINKKVLEITTFRTESGYSDKRHPDKISFADDYYEDAKRRDFTMNAIAYSPTRGFIDYFGGIEDIEKARIKAVGNADMRFCEDALRILRAIRFASVTGFEIELETGKALRRKADGLLKISMERVYAELVKLLCGKAAGAVIQEYFDVITVFMPELAPMQGFEQHNPHHDKDVLSHTLKALDSVFSDIVLRLTMLFHDSGKPETFSIDEAGIGHFYGHASVSANKAYEALRRLRASNEVTDRVIKLVKAHDAPIEADERIISHKISKLGARDFFDLLEVQRADCKALAPKYMERLEQYDQIEHIARELLKRNSCFSIVDLAVNGDDLLELGIAKGPEIGRVLNLLLNAVLDKKTENSAEALRTYIITEILKKQ